MLKVVVLISGTGSNLRALLQASAAADFPAQVIAVGADRDAPGLGYAEAYRVPTFTVHWRDYPDRDAWGEALAEQLRSWDPDVVILSGLMRLLPPRLIDEFAPTIINTHPAYLPEFPGAHGVRDALASGVTETGASVIVVDHGVDTGPILARERVPVAPGDDEARLHERIKPVERRLLAETIRRIATGELNLVNLSNSRSNT